MLDHSFHMYENWHSSETRKHVRAPKCKKRRPALRSKFVVFSTYATGEAFDDHFDIILENCIKSMISEHAPMANQ